jgi:hypothetical protein
MKHSIFAVLAVLALFSLTSCQAQTDAKKVAAQIKSTIEETMPGTLPTKEGGWTMKAKMNGKEWVASAMMPPDAPGRIIGYYNKESISFPFVRRDMVAGNKIRFSDHYAVDLFTNDETGIWGGRTGEMVITKVNGNWAEGLFHFTATARNTTKTIEVTDGFFRISLMPNPKE